MSTKTGNSVITEYAFHFKIDFDKLNISGYDETK